MTMTISGSGTITGLSAGGLPDATIVQADLATGVAGTGPAFSAIGTSSTSVTTATFTKVVNATEEFDTASCYNNTGSTVGGIPAYAFLPTVAGYYQISGQVAFSLAAGVNLATIYKNGTNFKLGTQIINSTSFTSSTVSAIVYLNGSTDYVELYTYQSSGGTTTTGGTYFQGSMVRAA